MKLITTLLATSVLVCYSIGHEASARDPSVRQQFMREIPCPANGHSSGPCPGYVVDHVVPLSCGGSDSTDNMQWQTVEEGKAKDKWERKGCQVARAKHQKQPTAEVKSNVKKFSCDYSKTCKKMTSCEEARFYLKECGDSSLDRDADGIPCESICKG